MFLMQILGKAEKCVFCAGFALQGSKQPANPCASTGVFMEILINHHFHKRKNEKKEGKAYAD